MTYPGPVVSGAWLAERLNDPSIRIVDATVHLPDTGRIARDEYLQAHIPGAGFFDFDEIADPHNPLPRKFPPKAVLERAAGRLGIDNSTHVVAYDTPGLYSAARVWWLFRQYGHDRVSILDGGLKHWMAEGRALQSGPVELPVKRFIAGDEHDLLALWPSVLSASGNAGEQIIDARTPGRFAGIEQDRYPGTRAGHIPNSLNLYWADLLDAGTRKLLPREQLHERFSKAGITWDKPVTATCGSGLTACILALGLHLCGKDDWKVYDGSWDEWGRRQDLPVTGQAPV